MASARRFVFTLFVLVALFRPTGLFAQEYPLVPDRPGSWSAPDVRGATLPPEARAAAVALANQLFEIIRRVPAIAPAAGFQVVQHLSRDGPMALCGARLQPLLQRTRYPHRDHDVVGHVFTLHHIDDTPCHGVDRRAGRPRASVPPSGARDSPE